MKITKIENDDIDELVVEKNQTQPKEEEYIDEKGKKRNQYYVDPHKLHAKLTEFYHAKQDAIAKGEPVPFITDDFVGWAIKTITTGLAQHHKFKGYHANWKTEMISDGIYHALKYVRAYNPYRKDAEGDIIRPNPHAYISMIVNNSFIQRIKKEKDEDHAQRQMFLRYDGFAANGLQLEEINGLDIDGVTGSDFYHSYAAESAAYEEKLAERRTRYAKPKEEVVVKPSQLESLFNIE